MAEDNISILKKIIEGRDKRTWGAIGSLISDDLVIEAYSLERTFKGKQGFHDFYALWDRAFPDGAVTPIQLFESGDYVIAELQGEGIQKGIFDTPFGAIAPTNRYMKLLFCDIFQFKDGKLVGQRSYLDLSAAFKQLGILSIGRQPKAAA